LKCTNKPNATIVTILADAVTRIVRKGSEFDINPGAAVDEGEGEHIRATAGVGVTVGVGLEDAFSVFMIQTAE
jgi:hypothetical protein